MKSSDISSIEHFPSQNDNQNHSSKLYQDASIEMVDVETVDENETTPKVENLSGSNQCPVCFREFTSNWSLKQHVKHVYHKEYFK